MAVTRAGIMEVYANHTFQPRAAIRRIDLAQVVSRILSASNVPPPPTRSRVQIADMGPDHLGYPAVSAAVSAGVLALNEGRFLPSVAVTGAEAVEAVARLERLVLKR
jgi:hypothetical protein